MKHPHGTDNAYTHDYCRCTPCREAHNKAARDRRRQQAYGRYTKNKRPTLKTLNHINQLRSQGITLRQIHEHTGVAMVTLGRITLGKTNLVQAATETRILNYKPTPEQASPHATTNATGTRRRLQALQYNGWDQDTLAQKLGSQRSHVWKLSHERVNVTVNLAKRVQDLYDEIWNQYPESSKGSNLARSISRRNGWLPPLCWDEDNIDNPNHHGYPKDIAA